MSDLLSAGELAEIRRKYSTDAMQGTGDPWDDVPSPDRLAVDNLLDHIDAMAAREAKLRELHVKRDETYFQWPVCGVCMDGEEMAAWPCDTIQILDGET